MTCRRKTGPDPTLGRVMRKLLTAADGDAARGGRRFPMARRAQKLFAHIAEVLSRPLAMQSSLGAEYAQLLRTCLLPVPAYAGRARSADLQSLLDAFAARLTAVCRREEEGEGDGARSGPAGEEATRLLAVLELLLKAHRPPLPPPLAARLRDALTAAFEWLHAAGDASRPATLLLNAASAFLAAAGLDQLQHLPAAYDRAAPFVRHGWAAGRSAPFREALATYCLQVRLAVRCNQSDC